MTKKQKSHLLLLLFAFAVTQDLFHLSILYTGGTIGSVGDPLIPLQGPQFSHAFTTLISPQISSKTSITIHSFEKTIDSTNIAPSQWIDISSNIVTNFDSSDGFLILHGTNTMAWTSSALSFLLPGITKPLIITGSQIPLFHQNPDQSLVLKTDSDALRNVFGAITFLENFNIPSVGLYFGDVLYQGNRVEKSDINHFPAFSSPKAPPLGKNGVVPVVYHSSLKNWPTTSFKK